MFALLCVVIASLLVSSVRAGYVQVGSKLSETNGKRLGTKCAMSGDGGYAVAGSQSPHLEVYKRIGSTWQRIVSNLTPFDNTTSNTGVGIFSLSMNFDGSLIAAAGGRENAVWLFVRYNDSYFQMGPKLAPTGGLGLFNAAVALSRDGTKLVTVDTHGSGPYFYEVNSNAYSKMATLGTFTYIGYDAVAFAGNGLVVALGSPIDNVSQGSAWIYKVNQNKEWYQFGPKLVSLTRQGMGFSVALSYDASVLVCGCSGDVMGVAGVAVFSFLEGNYVEQAPVTSFTGVSPNAGAGLFVALSEDGSRLVVGGPFDEIDNIHLGAVWTFVRQGHNFTQDGPQITGSGYFASRDVLEGSSLGLSASGDHLMIGGPYDHISLAYSGSLWFFDFVKPTHAPTSYPTKRRATLKPTRKGKTTSAPTKPKTSTPTKPRTPAPTAF